MTLSRGHTLRLHMQVAKSQQARPWVADCQWFLNGVHVLDCLVNSSRPRASPPSLYPVVECFD
jgi:hypothetical protein